jgi:HD-GYP domain-containing protein (c-di-GMP phosphodiesterase class II)
VQHGTETAMSIHKSGTQLVILFHALAKAVQVYDINNDVVQKAAQRLVLYCTNLFEIHAVLSFVRYRDYIFFNKQRLRFQIEGYASLQNLHDRMKALNIRTLSLGPGVTSAEIVHFALVFKEHAQTFHKKLTAKQFKHVTVEFATDDDEIPEFLKDTERVKRTYFKALNVTKNLMQSLWTDRPVDAVSSRRVVYHLIDALSQDEFGLLALTAIKNFDEYTYNHSLNVGVLSLALGQRIGLNRRDLAYLGTAGILHDIGKVEIPKKLIYKAGQLSNEEWETLKMHSTYGVKQILKIRGLDETGLVSLAVAYQHHWNHDGTGYPVRTGDEKPVLLAKIVRVCDSYDAMTTARIYQPIPYLPTIALRVLWKHQGKYFDPVIVKAFILLSGLYPIGSCIELSTDETALVIRQNYGHFELPIVRVVMDSRKRPVDEGAIVDLSEKRDVKILRPVYPQKYGITPGKYFI